VEAQAQTVQRAKPQAAAPEPSWTRITLRPDVGDEFVFESSPRLQQMAVEWTHVIRNRRRWALHEPTRRSQEDRVRNDLENVGLPGDVLRKLSQARVVEVSIPYSIESQGWEARILPWEYILTAATHRERHASIPRSMTVVRHLDCGDKPAEKQPPLTTKDIPSVAFVRSSPGPVGDYFNFADEEEMMRGSFPESGQGNRYTLVPNPSRDQLKKALKEKTPHLLHFAGVDTHQAAALGWTTEPAGGSTDPCDGDGYVIDQGGLAPFGCLEFQSLFEGMTPVQRPRLSAFNFYFSGPRIAAMVVAGGSGAAIGFQDEFDDRLTELFFSNFYPGWRLSEWNLLSAFRHGCDRLRAVKDGLVGTGVLLWSRESLVAPLREASSTPSKGRTETPSEPTIQEKVEEAARATEYTAKDLSVTIEPYAEINYSMLQNDRRWFRQFLLTRPPAVGYVPDVDVKVELTLGMGVSHTVEKKLQLYDRQVDLTEAIQFPLIYGSGHGAREAVHTILKVHVEAGKGNGRAEVHDSINRVSLLPLEEWKDDPEGRAFLPSFVLPRDPAVIDVIDSAQRYLMALLDDGQAGFDGYQSLGASDSAEADEVVDLQVQAIWSALVYDRALYYINPPPTYTPGSQRVRTPSEVLLTKRGTCIDLALMVAACLEFIEIYPVIILLKGHAFPAYWRSHAAWKAFWQGRPEQDSLRSGTGTGTGTGTGAGTGAGTGTGTGTGTGSGSDTGMGTAVAAAAAVARTRRQTWYQTLDGAGGGADGRGNLYEEVQQLVRRRMLVPLETVWLTQRGSFYGAIEEGAKNLRFKDDFEAMLDVTMARQGGVTPIPFHFRETHGR
jgi:hypothetical protein